MGDRDTGRELRQAVLAALSAGEKIELAERESRDLLAFNPGYGADCLRRKFGATEAPDGEEQEGRPPASA